MLHAYTYAYDVSDEMKCFGAISLELLLIGYVCARLSAYLTSRCALCVRTSHQLLLKGTMLRGAAKCSTMLWSASLECGVTLKDWAKLEGMSSPTFGLIIDEESLSHALKPEMERELYDLAMACNVVICSGFTPLQNEKVVSLVKRKSRELNLAVKYVNWCMMQMVDVGVTICGEGWEALASRFAFAKFRFLACLLLLHGRSNYVLSRHMILYIIYRNDVLAFLLFWNYRWCMDSLNLINNIDLTWLSWYS